MRFGIGAGALLMALLILLPGGVMAEWVDVEGRAAIYRSDIAAAREAARRDALEQARLTAGGHLTAHDEVRDGRVVESSLSLRSDLRIGRVVQVAETVMDDWLSIQFRIQVLPQPVCPRTEASRYRKNVVFTRFALDPSAHADIGGLFDADEHLPEMLMARLGTSAHLEVLNGSHLTLYENVATSPTVETDARVLTQVLSLARSLGAQFVVSGAVRSLAPLDEGTFGTSVWDGLLRTVGQADRAREFVADLYVHDGFSGALLQHRRYRTEGEWGVALHDRVPLNSAAFAATDYGAAVLAEINGMAADVEGQVACQPFITRIRKVEDKTLMIESGATQGVKPGDLLQVYRTRQLFEGTRYQGTELKDVKLALRVNQVQPELAFGDLSVDPTRYNVQTDDLLVVW